MRTADTDDAVSTVIALMLVLAIVATCMAIYSATYVPGLKQQAEITHSEDVKFAFERFSADADAIYSLGKAAQFSEPLSLGGGDVLLSPVRSSGTVEISRPVSVGDLYINGTWHSSIDRVRVVYTPSYSSWDLQGYSWENGLVWVTKGEKKTPATLSLYTVSEGKKRESEILAESFVRMSENFVVVSMYPETKNSITGTGIAKLRLHATESEPIQIPVGESVKIVDSSGREYSFPAAGGYTLRQVSVGVSVE